MGVLTFLDRLSRVLFCVESLSRNRGQRLLVRVGASSLSARFQIWLGRRRGIRGLTCCATCLDFRGCCYAISDLVLRPLTLEYRHRSGNGSTDSRSSDTGDSVRERQTDIYERRPKHRMELSKSKVYQGSQANSQ